MTILPEEPYEIVSKNKIRKFLKYLTNVFNEYIRLLFRF